MDGLPVNIARTMHDPATNISTDAHAVTDSTADAESHTVTNTEPDSTTHSKSHTFANAVAYPFSYTTADGYAPADGHPAAN